QTSAEEQYDGCPGCTDRLFELMFNGVNSLQYTGGPLFPSHVGGGTGGPLNGRQDIYDQYSGSTETHQAIFANVGYNVTDTLKLTVGERYDRETFKFDNF